MRPFIPARQAGGVFWPLPIKNVLRELKKPKEKRLVAESAMYRARRELANKGLISYQNGFWRITERGKAELKHKEITSGKLSHPDKWDKKWRILIFDIREEKKQLREKIRRTLVAMGFRHLQDSVWIFPYNCEDFVALLKADFKIGRELVYIIADAVESDIELRKLFGLLQ